MQSQEEAAAKGTSQEDGAPEFRSLGIFEDGWEIGVIDGPDGPRRVRRRKRKNKKNRKHLVGKIAILALIGIGLFTLPLPIGNIEIKGSSQITEDDVITVGDLGRPVNILRVRTGALEERLQKDLRVDTARVSYGLPLTLQVDIVERKIAVVVPSQFGFIGVDRQGIVISNTPNIPDTTVPIISGIRLGNVLLGDKIEGQGILHAIEYVTAFEDSQMSPIGEVNIGDEHAMIAYTADGLPIHLGDSNDLKEKAKLTEDMLKDIKNKHMSAQYIEVNIKSPYIKTP